MSVFTTSCCKHKVHEGVPSQPCCEDYRTLCDSLRGKPNFDFGYPDIFARLYQLCEDVEDLHDGELYVSKVNQTRNEFLDLLDHEKRGQSLPKDFKDLGMLAALRLLRAVGNQRATPLLGSYEPEGHDDCDHSAHFSGMRSELVCLGQTLTDEQDRLSVKPEETDATVDRIMVLNSIAVQNRKELMSRDISLKKKQEEEAMSGFSYAAISAAQAVGDGSLRAVQATAYGTAAVANVAAAPLRMLQSGFSGMFSRSVPVKPVEPDFNVEFFKIFDANHPNSSDESEDFELVVGENVEVHPDVVIYNDQGDPSLFEGYFCPKLLSAFKYADIHTIRQNRVSQIYLAPPS